VRFVICVCLLFHILPSPATAQEKSFVLALPEAPEIGVLMDYVLPRFSLKTSVRITRVGADGPADMALNAQNIGMPVFQGAGAVWYLETITNNDHTMRFSDWIASEPGSRAITGFAPEGVALFTLPEIIQTLEIIVPLTGDIAMGETLSLTNCGRCHVVNESNRMKAIGSTPSFALMRTFEDWRDRFETFYVLNPHPAFTQIKDVTEAFDPARPSPIVPMAITLDDLEDIVTYVATIVPADLGAPIQSQ
jgi:hypothetical protein